MKLRTKDMILISLFAALTAVGAFLRIPMQPVAFTLQMIFVMYAGLLLGGYRAFLSQTVYVAAGLLGAPIFAGGAGGPGYVLSPSFGYLIGFILAAFAIGKLSEKVKSFTIVKAAAILLIGMAIIYSIGVPYLYFIVTQVLGKDMSVSGAVAAGFTPFILLDLTKVAITAVTAVYIIPIMKKAGVLD